MLTVEDGLTVAAGAAAFAAGVLTVCADGLAVAAGAVASAAGVLTVSEDGLAVAAGAVASAAGVLAVSADGLLESQPVQWPSAAGALGGAGVAVGSMTVCEEGSSRNRCNSGRGTVVGDHVQFGDGKAVVSGAGTRGPTCFVPNEVYVMAQMRLEINTAGGDLENLTSAVFRNCVVAIRSTQATFNVGLVRIAASVGSLRKPQRHQQARYNHQ